MPSGRVKKYDPDRGFGFIQPDDGGDDCFVHVTELRRSHVESLVEGDRVQFDLQPDPKGRRDEAVNIAVLK
jgi:CspA family cold shock protein